MSARKTNKKPDDRPARLRYWDSGRLAVRKIRNLVRSGYTAKDAISLWEKSRKRFKGTVNLVQLSKIV